MNGLAFTPPLLSKLRARMRWASKARRGQGSRSASTTLGFASLPATDGHRYGMDDFRSQDVLVIAFISNRCPWVKAYDARLSRLQHDYWHRGVQFIAINSLGNEQPGEDLASMHNAARRRRFPFPYLKDHDQRVATTFGVATAPHVVVLDKQRRVRYTGQVDDAFRESKVKHHYLRDALDNVLARKRVWPMATLPFGCQIRPLASVRSPADQLGTVPLVQGWA